MKSDFDKAISRIQKLDQWLGIRHWEITNYGLDNIEDRIAKLQADEITNQIKRLERFLEEACATRDNKLYGMDNKLIKTDARDKRLAATECKRLQKEIAYLHEVWLELP